MTAWPTYRALIQRVQSCQQQNRRGKNQAVVLIVATLISPHRYSYVSHRQFIHVPTNPSYCWFLERTPRGKMYEGKYRQQLSIENRVCVLLRKIKWNGFIIIDWCNALHLKLYISRFYVVHYLRLALLS